MRSLSKREHPMRGDNHEDPRATPPQGSRRIVTAQAQSRLPICVTREIIGSEDRWNVYVSRAAVQFRSLARSLRSFAPARSRHTKMATTGRVTRGRGTGSLRANARGGREDTHFSRKRSRHTNNAIRRRDRAKPSRSHERVVFVRYSPRSNGAS